MKLKTKIIIVSVVLFIIAYVGLLSWIVWRKPAYDKDCLAEIGFEYCVNNNMSWHRTYNWNSFYCKSYEDSRTEQGYLFEYFYFLDDEMESCLRRKAKSWEKLR